MPARRSYSVLVYVLILLAAMVGIVVFIYREGEASREDAKAVVEMLEGLEAARGTFYKLDPMRSDPTQSPKKPQFQGWTLLAEQPLKPEEVRDLRDILTSKDTYGRDAIKCFEPGMGFRLQTDSRVLDLVVCLSCQKYVAHDGPVVKSWNLSKSGCDRFAVLYKAHVPQASHP